MHAVKCVTMADGTSLNSSCLTSRAKKVANISSCPNTRRKTRQSHRRDIHNRVVLEKVLGITVSSGSGLTSDPNTGLVAYPAGCVIVLLNPKKNKQAHILNTSRKTFSAVAFSQNGKFLVTGESGHMPCVRVWDVAERTQVAEVQCHKHGVACVAFSPNGSYIVSMGYQHDRTVSVWEWKKGVVIAANKVSSRVLAVSFSEDNSYFVTAGNRHVKFWYLDASKEKRNSQFCGVACGHGSMAGSTYCITYSGLLCQFNSSRHLDLWVDLKTTSAQCLSVSDAFVFCGCADGTVRVFNPQDLHYITTLHRPHSLGVDVTHGKKPGHLFGTNPEAQYPDTLALTFDPKSRHLTCVYNDHSVYVWDVRDIRNVGKVYSALYHSGCVWSVETYAELADSSAGCLSPGAFLTCSSDNTIRLWKSESLQSHSPGLSLRQNLYSQDVVKIVYVDDDTQFLKAEAEKAEGGSQDVKSGIRVLAISPDGQHLAAGDRSGNLRIFGLQFMDELQKIEAHDSEVLCLAFSTTQTGLYLLASASRDRLIHVFDMVNSCNLVQTVYDHSASITAIKFTGVSSELCMVSCGADKSIYFRSAEETSEGLNFLRSHHIVEKATLYDMDLDATQTHVAIACQDRNIRVYDVGSGKMKKCFKGSVNDDGTLLKVQFDPSGMFVATSCSDKNICIYDYESGECVASLFGHSEIVTGMKFSQDCKHLITVSGDSCVFVWRLDSQMTNSMRKRLAERKQRTGLRLQRVPTKHQAIRRETYIMMPCSALPQMDEQEEEEEEEEEEGVEEEVAEDCKTSDELESSDASLNPMILQSNGKMPKWVRRLDGREDNEGVPVCNMVQYQPQGRWAVQSESLAIRTVLEKTSTLQKFSPSEQGEANSGFLLQSLDSLLDEDLEEEPKEKIDDSKVEFNSSPPGAQFLQPPHGEESFNPELGSPEKTGYILYPANSTALSTGEGEFDVKALCEKTAGDPEEELSPDSACSTESPASQSDPLHDQDTDSLSQVSSTGSSGIDDEEDNDPGTLLRQHFDTLGDAANEKFCTDPRSLEPTTESNFINPRLSISTRFLSRFQGRFRSVGTSSSGVSQPALLLPSIPDESSDGKTLDSTMESSKPASSGKIEETEKIEITNKTKHKSPSTTSDNVSQVTISSDASQSRSRQSYMGATASSRAKITHSSSVESLNSCTSDDAQLNGLHAVEESKENMTPLCSLAQSPATGNHSARASLRLDLAGSARGTPSPLLLKTRQVEVERSASPRRHALVTPTEMRSLGKECLRKISHIEQSLKHTQRFTAPGLVKKEEVICDPVDASGQVSVTQGTNSSIEDTGVSMQMCKMIVNDLWHTIHKATGLYSQLCAVPEISEPHEQMKSILQEVFVGVRSKLNAFCPSPESHPSTPRSHPIPEDSPGRQLRDDRAVALLEKYSEMLLLRIEKGAQPQE
ncbi:hypothetical protein DNTS_006348 [Danionella cerebrum]|uniref:Anaphase-promoting complex subunit 4 WD40 domain-containing protein n=1 Tax=Danionella cerebrum TaxID=2873325 RepID=A0A553Q5E0_9TELE|nr:hypothetical protein DNTS_006348 [Danionella translucida]